MGRILMALWCIAVGVVCGEVLFSSIKSVICIYIASVPFWMD